MLGFAEERRVVGAVVQAHHFQAVQVGAFEQVERGRCLAEGPQPGKRQAQHLAQDHAVDRIVRNHQQGVVLAEAFGGAGQATPAALQHQAQRFAAGHQHRIRLLAPGLQARRILLVDLAGQQPFPFTVGDFLQLRLGQQHVGAGGTKRQLRGPLRARQRRGDGTGDVHRGQAGTQSLGLGFADRRKRDVDLALVAAFGVPRRFAVAGKQDAHACKGSWGEEVSAFRSHPVKHAEQG